MIELIYWDLENNPVTIEQYKNFLYSYFGEDAESRYVRVQWYRKRGDYQILLALENGMVIGQSCVYQVLALIEGHRTKISWSVDTFVLPVARGKSIGKKLQKKLHEDFPNFTSLWYSKINGIIKRKCGGEELVKVPFNFYSVNSFFSVLWRIFLRRILGKNISLPKVWENKYYCLNSLRLLNKKYDVKEVDLVENLDDYVLLANKALLSNDFYIIRDPSYVSWKYIENPTIGRYNVLFVYSRNKPNDIVGAILFSEPHTKLTFSIPLKIFTVLDCFVLPDTGLTKRELLCAAIQFYHERKVIVDGVLTLMDFSYYPFLRYPWKGTQLLSTYKKKGEIHSPYFSYSDQDMEQMIL